MTTHDQIDKLSHAYENSGIKNTYATVRRRGEGVDVDTEFVMDDYYLNIYIDPESFNTIRKVGEKLVKAFQDERIEFSDRDYAIEYGPLVMMDNVDKPWLPFRIRMALANKYRSLVD